MNERVYVFFHLEFQYGSLLAGRDLQSFSTTYVKHVPTPEEAPIIQTLNYQCHTESVGHVYGKSIQSKGSTSIR